jgi:CAP-Gly domain-containing linker protein 1
MSLQLDGRLQDLQDRLDEEHARTSELQQALDEHTSELESMRKRLNRDTALNNGLHDIAKASPPSPPSTASAEKEEVRGLR